jgi:hypothetical protein
MPKPTTPDPNRERFWLARKKAALLFQPDSIVDAPLIVIIASYSTLRRAEPSIFIKGTKRQAPRSFGKPLTPWPVMGYTDY